MPTVTEDRTSRIDTEIGITANTRSARTFNVLLDSVLDDPIQIIKDMFPVGSPHPWPSVQAYVQSYRVADHPQNPMLWKIHVVYSPDSSLTDQGWNIGIRGYTETRQQFQTIGDPGQRKIIGPNVYRFPIGPNSMGIPPDPPGSLFRTTFVTGEQIFLVRTGARRPIGYSVPKGGLAFTFTKKTTTLTPATLASIAPLLKKCNSGSFRSYSSIPGTVLFWDMYIASSSGTIAGIPPPGGVVPIDVSLEFILSPRAFSPIIMDHTFSHGDAESVIVDAAGDPVVEAFPIIEQVNIDSAFAAFP